MRLQHLALPVSDQDRSRRFYERYFGFGVGPARRYPDGVLILHDRDNFALALGPAGSAPALPDFLHFGFEADADEVRRMLARLEEDGVEIVEREDEPSYVGFKCLDPDGYTVEVSWEPAEAGTRSSRPQAPKR
jgi:catechol 2,3-dioxygenase-like lactoylglutathione lyase family enzyme